MAGRNMGGGGGLPSIDEGTGKTTVHTSATAHGPFSSLPEWWGMLDQSYNPLAINYGDIQFPLSNAIAPDLLLPVCYGEVRIGGTTIGFGGVPGSEMTHGWGAIVWCEGEIESIDSFMVNGMTKVPYTNGLGSTLGLAHFTGNGTQYCQDNTSDLFCPYPRTNPGTGSSGPYDVQGLKTAAYTRIDLTSTIQFWWQTIAAAEDPGPYEFAADVHGLKLYDPRDGGQDPADPTTWLYSNNPALIVRDLYVRFGKLPEALIDEASFIAAANACDTAGFTCNIAFAAKTTLADALAVVLQTCNGFVVESDGKRGMFVDVVNAGAAVATLSEAEGDVWGLDYEWVSARDRYTSVTVAFLNKDADYKPDMTLPFEDPGIALGTVPLKPIVVSAPGINTAAAAIILRDYLYNSQTISFRAKGTANARGILYQQGMKVRLVTLKGVDADFLITQISGTATGFFTFVAKPYSAAVYGTTPLTANPPVTDPPGPDANAPPPPAAGRHQSGMPPSGANSGIAFDAPRVYTESGPYGSGDWTISGTGASGDTAKINDGVTTVVAVTSTDTMDLFLDRGVVAPEVFGRLNFWIDSDLGTLLQYGHLAVKYSDDNIAWTDALVSGAGYLATTPWNDPAVSGVYPCHVEIPDSIGAHRYWWISFWGIAAGLGTLNLYEAQWDTFTAYTGAVVGYQIRTWPGGGYDGAFPNDLLDYSTPDPASPAVFTLSTLPTDGAPFYPVDVGPLFTVDGTPFTTQASTFRGALTTVGVNVAGEATPLSGREVVSASATVVNDIDGYSGSLHLVAGTNMTITQSGGDTFTFDAAGGGGGSRENSSTTVDGVAVTFTFSTTVAAGDWIFADGRLLDETIGDYTRSTNTVTLAVAPISTVKRMF